jgi:hypothetical protein
MKTQESGNQWAIQAAQNAVGILGDLTDPGEEIPFIRIDEMVGRIQSAFLDRVTWNQAVHFSPGQHSLSIMIFQG